MSILAPSYPYLFAKEGPYDISKELRAFVCPVCGKEFYPTPGIWAYKARANKNTFKDVNVCSYHCQRVVEKRKGIRR